MKKIRWGILSTAQIAENSMIPAIKESKNSIVWAVASRNSEKARTFAARLGIPKSYGSYEELLRDPEIDAIYNPLPVHLHAEWSIKAGQAGKPVLCEKPLAANSAEAKAMFHEFTRLDLPLQEALMYKYHPLTTKAMDLLKSGAIGQIRMVHAQFNTTVKEGDIRLRGDTGGGALLDIGSYCVSVMRLMAGEEPVEIAATGKIDTANNIDLGTAAVFRFPSGIIGHFGCGLQTEFDCSYGAAGTKGHLLVDWGAMCAWPGEDFKIKLWKGDDYSEIIVPAANHYQLLVEDFAEALLKGERHVRMRKDSENNLLVIDQIFKAIGL